TERSDLQRGDAVRAVVDGAGGTGEMEDVVHFAHVEGLADVLFYEFKSGFISQMREVGQAAGEQVVDDNHPPTFGQQGIAEVGAEKSSATGNQRALQSTH